MPKTCYKVLEVLKLAITDIEIIKTVTSFLAFLKSCTILSKVDFFIIVILDNISNIFRFFSSPDKILGIIFSSRGITFLLFSLF